MALWEDSVRRVNEMCLQNLPTMKQLRRLTLLQDTGLPYKVLRVLATLPHLEHLRARPRATWLGPPPLPGARSSAASHSSSTPSSSSSSLPALCLPSLTSFRIDSCGNLRADDLPILSEATVAPRLHTLDMDFESYWLPIDQLMSAHMHNVMSRLIALTLRRTKVDEDYEEELAEWMRNMTQLTSLSVFDTRGPLFLLSSLPHCSTLRHLSIHQCGPMTHTPPTPPYDAPGVCEPSMLTGLCRLHSLTLDTYFCNHTTVAALAHVPNLELQRLILGVIGWRAGALDNYLAAVRTLLTAQPHIKIGWKALPSVWRRGLDQLPTHLHTHLPQAMAAQIELPS